MYRFLLIAFASLMPSAHAVDYLKCETIRSIMIRNELQMKEKIKSARYSFPILKAREKYGTPSSQYLKTKGDACYMHGGDSISSKEYKEREAFKKTVWTNFKTEGEDLHI